MEIASRELRNNTRALLDRVESGEEVTITVNGRPIALLTPVRNRPMWMARNDFVQQVLSHQADPDLRRELAALSPDTTDDISVS